jgi:Sulfotransferase family
MSDAILSSASLVDQARVATGLDDFGEDSWREGLERLLDSLRGEARLSEMGEQIAAAMIVNDLTSRLRVTDWHERCPEIGAAPIPPPVVVLGQPRTGTTILFDLLAQDRRLRAPLTWEVANPHPPPETATYATDPRIAESEAAAEMTELVNPGFRAVHPSGALRGQECVVITSGDFRSMTFPTVFRVPSYMRWLISEADMASAYRYHRRFLQLLQWRHPGERWVLKTPAHTWCLPALFAAYPDATIVQTHRDPLKVVASVASLTEHLQRMVSGQTTIPAQAEEWVDYLALGNERSVTAREDGTVPPDQAVDLLFRDLMTDPFAAIADLYADMGLEYTAEADAGMRAFLAAHPADEHGTHTYSFAATGLDQDEVRARMQRYETYFGVPREPLG